MEQYHRSAEEEICVKQGILTWDRWTTQLSLAVVSTIVNTRKKKVHRASGELLVLPKKCLVASEDAW